MKVYLLKNPSGMTLIELIVAMTLFSFLTIFAGQNLRDTLKKNKKISMEIDSRSKVFQVFQLMRQDIQSVFNHRDLDVELFNRSRDKRLLDYIEKEKKETEEIKKANPGLNPSALAQKVEEKLGKKPEFVAKTEKITTYFKGDKTSLYFTSLSLPQLVVDEKIADLGEISYWLAKCPTEDLKEKKEKKASDSPDTSCLWRSQTAYLDGDYETTESAFVILEDIISLEWTYLDNTKEDDWREDWSSFEEDGDTDTQNKPPYGVHLKLEMLDKKNVKAKPLVFKSVFPIVFHFKPPIVTLKSLKNP